MATAAYYWIYRRWTDFPVLLKKGRLSQEKNEKEKPPMKIWAVFYVFVLLNYIVVSFSIRSWCAMIKKTTYDYEATVIRVIDGDTVECDVDMGLHIKSRARIRLQGINAPELHSNNEDERKRAEEARQYLVERLQDQKVWIFTYSEDSFGRWLGTIFTEDATNINKEMVDKGLAAEYMMEKDFDLYWESMRRIAEEKLQQCGG